MLDIVRVNNFDMRSYFDYGDAVLIQKSFYTLKTGDALYVRYPLTDSIMTRSLFVQRVYGLPGDTFEIKQAEVYVNGHLVDDSVGIRQNYFVKSTCELDSLTKAQYGLIEGGVVSDSHDYSFSMSKQQVGELKLVSDIKSIEPRIEKPNTYDENCFPFSSQFVWNADNYGKLRIPQKNDTLTLDTSNVALYSLLISEHEKNHLEVRADSIFINGEFCKSYVVKKNYYFLLGDNRGNANDSRNWGFLPENMIIGKVLRKVRKK